VADLKTLRKRCEARLATIDFVGCVGAASFCSALAVHRERPIILRPVTGWVGPCGLWVGGPSADLIFYEQETSPLHRDHIILHEASHLICGHSSAEIPPSALSVTLFPDLRPDAVWQVLQRATYAAGEEQEAELLASLIFERLSAGRGGPSHVTDPKTAGLLGRLGTSLEEGPGTAA